MPDTNVSVLDESIHKTNAWLDEIEKTLGAQTRQAAFVALRSVLHALRDRLTVDEAAHLSAQLPMFVRGVFYDGYRPAKMPFPIYEKKAFLAHVGEGFGGAGNLGFSPEQATKAVFAALNAHVSPGEIEDVRMMLNTEIRELWPEPA
ncbi:DUF2267 domain-containing protein [Marinicauda salina]|uniref:DUF2267 domain-containing protein n=1 Tax=Marinicauda salina TaxID=2135793 RepID=A0A2U2BSF1_9PROT|nr:DUF2267 domain-containing protein [Marinicauda salina]PWE16943.1 DUF2267 domain-containing protein [Marinicauda salina]